jgi:hypothetical protein
MDIPFIPSSLVSAVEVSVIWNESTNVPIRRQKAGTTHADWSTEIYIGKLAPFVSAKL